MAKFEKINKKDLKENKKEKKNQKVKNEITCKKWRNKTEKTTKIRAPAGGMKEVVHKNNTILPK